MTTSMTIRMDPEIKKESQELFRSLGLDMTTAINLFLRQSLMHRGLPFEVRQPRYNAETEAAMQEAELTNEASFNAADYNQDGVIDAFDMFYADRYVNTGTLLNG